MRYLIILLVLLFFYVNLIGQSRKVFYFDSNWKSTTSSYYTYYRVINYTSDGGFVNPVIDYYRSGKQQMVLYTNVVYPWCATFPTDCGTTNGEATWYSENGSLSSWARFKDGKTYAEKLYNSYGSLTHIEGCISGDCQNGYGVYYYKEGDRYEGYFSSGYRHGNGKYKWASSGNTYNGLFKNGEIDKTQSTSYNISAQDVKDGLEIATKLVELYKAFNKD